MKILTSLALMGVFCLTGCATDGYYYQSSNEYYQRPSYYSRPYQQEYQPCEQRIVVGPQYYKTFVDCNGPVRFKNYMDAPVVVERPQGGAVIVPRSWN